MRDKRSHLPSAFSFNFQISQVYSLKLKQCYKINVQKKKCEKTNSTTLSAVSRFFLFLKCNHYLSSEERELKEKKINKE